MLSNQTNNPIAKAVKLALLAGFASVIATPAAFAAEGKEEVERIEVTGSRIKRTDVEGANPVTSISREDLDINADTNVQDFIQSLTQNTFGSFRSISGSSAPGQATVNLRGLGSGRTLVLINGRRMAGSPVLGNGSQNLSTIPMAAVERIEVLADGSSAIYGSEAIGGVVNVILRKDFEGVEVTAYRSRTTEEGGDVESGSIVGGSTFEKGNFVYSVDFERKDIIYQKDRSVTFDGLNNTSGTGPYGGFQRLDANWRNNFDSNPNNNVSFMDRNGNTVVSPYYTIPDTRAGTDGVTRPGARRVEGEIRNPLCPNDTLNPAGGTCRYRYPFNAAADTDNKRVGGFFALNYDINEEWQFSTSARMAEYDSFGRYAPAPFVAGSDIRVGQPPIVVPASSPYNLSGMNNGVLTDVAVNRSRPLALGNRDSFAENSQADFIAALSGSVGDLSVEAGLQFNRHKVRDIGYNYALRDKFRTAVESGAFDPFNPANNTSAAAIDAMRTTIVQDAQTDFKAADFSVSGDLFEMPAGALAFAAGAEYRDEEFFVKTDSQSNAGNVFGSAGGASAGGRTVTSIFTEFSIPVLENLELSPAVRHDSYNDVGSKTTYKLSTRYQPIENLILRGALGTGFRAPTLDDLLAAPAEGYPTANDPQTGITQQYLQVSLSNPNLTPEQSDHLNLGVVFEPIENMSMSADWFHIEIEDVITTLGINALLTLESAGKPLPAPTAILRNSDGSLASVRATQVNSGILETEGVDVNFSYKFDIGSAGTLSTELNWTHLMSWEDNPVAGFPDVDDNIGFAGVPENRVTLNLGWTMGDHRVSYIGNWTDDTYSTTPGNAQGGSGSAADPYSYDCTNAPAAFSLIGQDGCEKVGTYFTYDMQYSWTAPWNATIAVGGKNMANRMPPVNSWETRGYTESLYDLVGREYYARYTQRF